MISKSISTSKQVSGMSEFAQLLFTWAIPHADDFGRMDGDPEVVLATVIPMKRDRSPEDVVEAVKEWVNASLVWWFCIDSQPVIELRTWEKHQTGLNKRTKSKYPSYEESRSSEKFREILRNSSLTELNRTELNGTEKNDESLIQSAYTEVMATKEKDSSSFLSDLGTLGRLFQTEGFGQTTELVKEHLIHMLDDYQVEWIISAFGEAVRQNVRKLPYVQRMLDNWRKEGRMTIGEGGANIEFSIRSGKSETIRGPNGRTKSITGGRTGKV